MTVKKVLRRFAAVTTEIPRIHYREGLESGFMGNYESAIESFDRVNYITVGSSFWTSQSQFFKAEAYAKLEQHEKAHEEYKKFLEDNKKSTKGWNNLGASYLDCNKNDEAIRCLDTAIELELQTKNPDEVILESALTNKADVLIENYYINEGLEKNEKFLNSFEHCINEILKINSQSPDALNYKSGLLWMQDKNDEALENEKLQIKLFPNNWACWNGLGSAYNTIDNSEEALKCFEKGIKIKPDEDLLWYNKACMLSKMNKIDDALDALLVAISIAPENLLEISDESDFDNIKNSERFKKFLTIPV